MQWFKIYGQKWFTGSTRFELEPDERGAWIDILARASINEPPGQIDYFSFEQLRYQFHISLELLERTLNKCELFKKIKISPKKQIISILNWKKYQSEYQRQLPYRQKDIGQIKVTKSGDNSYNEVTLREKEKDKKREKRRKGEEERAENPSNEISQNISYNPFSHPSSIPSTANSDEGKTEVLDLLKNAVSIGYPYDQAKDEALFYECKRNYPEVDIVFKIKKKIEYWQKKKPGSIGKNPREQLREWIRTDFKAKGDIEPIIKVISEIGVLNEKPYNKILRVLSEKRQNE